MSPERQAFKNIEAWLSQREPLKVIAIQAFYDDHPEVRQLFNTPEDYNGVIVNRLEVNLHGESAAYKYFHEELPVEHSKLKKCLEIMEDLFRRMG